MAVENNDTTYKPRGTPYSFGQYAAISIILTPILAVLLSFYGFIPFDIFQAAISGIAVSLIYVGYRGYYWTQYRKDDREAIRKQLEDTTEE
ncbi:MAG: hypothetical protein ACW98Y_09310 [Candidatus Thorarchaeota archaeon]|jgi:hypothetical protein